MSDIDLTEGLDELENCSGNEYLGNYVKSLVAHYSGASCCIYRLEHDDHDSRVYPMYYFSNNNFFKYIGTFMFSFYINIRRALRSIKNRALLVY